MKPLYTATSLRNVIRTALTSAILIMDSACNQCGPNSGGLFIQEAWGDWQLVRETRPSLTLTSFSTIRSIQIKPGGDRNGNAVTKERLYDDSTLVNSLQWDVWDPDCKRRTFVVSYDTNRPIWRKYWVRDNFLFASGYLQTIGGDADTITYQYKRIEK